MICTPEVSEKTDELRKEAFLVTDYSLATGRNS